MTTELKEIKTRYPGKCAKCGREIKVDWNVFFNPDTKQMFCKPCVKGAENAPLGGVIPKEFLDKLSLEAQEELRLLGTIDGRLEKVQNTVDLICGSVSTTLDMIAALNTSMSVLHTQVESLSHPKRGKETK